MRITTFALGPLATNGYLLDEAGKALFIDPGGDPASVIKTLERENLELLHILNTHFHFDHIFGNTMLAEATGANILANPEDEFLLETEVGGGGFMGFPRVGSFSFEPIAEGEREFLGHRCKVLATPGHTPGSLSFYFPDRKAVFVGDLVFERSIGRTDFPGGDMETLLASARKKIFSLPEDTVIYSGHGGATTVGDEKNHNPFFS